jgi:membrane protease YdiL (CAAX protease family)
MRAEQKAEKYLGWKTLGAFALGFAAVWIGGAVWGIGATQVGRLLRFSDTSISTLSLLGVATIRLAIWIPVTRAVLKHHLLRDLAFPFHRGWWADLLVGVGMTSLAILVAFIASVKAGWLIIEGWMWQLLPLDALLGKLWVSLLINVLVALVEEVAFRAYLLTGLRAAWGRPIGLAVMAAAFGLMHTPALEGSAPSVLVIALLLLTAFGVVFGWVYLHTGSLWLPIGIHFAWDFVENDLLNLSGDMANPHVVGAMARLAGPSSLPGIGNAVLVDTLAFAILCAGIWLWICTRQRLAT